jgi:hypothetical protein
MCEESDILQLVVNVACECEDENGETLDECTGKCPAALAQAEYEQLLAAQEKLSAQLEEQRRQAQAGAHVIVEVGISHAELDRCNCDECNEVRRGLVEAGYLEQRQEDET